MTARNGRGREVGDLGRRAAPEARNGREELRDAAAFAQQPRFKDFQKAGLTRRRTPVQNRRRVTESASEEGTSSERLPTCPNQTVLSFEVL